MIFCLRQTSVWIKIREIELEGTFKIVKEGLNMFDSLHYC
jgi:hypothetical protein